MTTVKSQCYAHFPRVNQCLVHTVECVTLKTVIVGTSNRNHFMISKHLQKTTLLRPELLQFTIMHVNLLKYCAFRVIENGAKKKSKTWSKDDVDLLYITITCLCNIQQFLKAVKMIIFR